MQTGPFTAHLTGNEAQPQSLSIEISYPRPDSLLVTPVGEADLYTVPSLRQALDEGIASGRSHVTVDLDRFTFMDASLLGVLVEVRSRLVATEGTLRVRCRNDHRRRMLFVTGLDDMLDDRA